MNDNWPVTLQYDDEGKQLITVNINDVPIVIKAENVEFLDIENQSSVVHVAKPTANKEHPTMKPVILCAKWIENSSQKGDMVMDLFGGSGSTLIACEQLNRRARLMELSPHFCDVIVKRWEILTGKKAKLVRS